MIAWQISLYDFPILTRSRNMCMISPVRMQYLEIAWKFCDWLAGENAGLSSSPLLPRFHGADERHSRRRAIIGAGHLIAKMTKENIKLRHSISWIDA